jgi:uncharacterized protein YukE
VAHNPDGTSTWTYTDDGTADKTLVHRGADNRITRMESDGWTFTEFDSKDRPLGGNKSGSPNETVKAEYAGAGSKWTYDDGKGNVTVITKNKDDQVIMMTTGGWTFSEFNAAGRPLSGSKPGEDGKKPETATVIYNEDGSSVWTYIDSDGGRSVLTRNASDDVVKMEQDGWTYTDFDADGRPLSGTKGDETVSINYGSKDITESTFVTPDGHRTIFGTDKDGRPVFQIVDGAPAAFAVEIPKLKMAINTVKKEKESLENDLASIKKYFQSIDRFWDSPAGSRFTETYAQIESASEKISQVLSQSIISMQRSYDHYLDAEGGNLNNLVPATNSSTYNSHLTASILADIIRNHEEVE